MKHPGLRQVLQAYLDAAYPGAEIETPHSIFGDVHVRYELGDELKNGTKGRVQQATDRAVTLFKETFEDPEQEIWVLFYEYHFPGAANEHLRKLLGTATTFYDEVEEVNTQYIVKDENGISGYEKAEQGVVIGKLAVKNINAAEIFSGIANTEMGSAPCIDQRLIFMCPITDRAFLMYDDRGCYVWSNVAAKIEPLYSKYNHWIVDYHRPEIDAYFL